MSLTRQSPLLLLLVVPLISCFTLVRKPFCKPSARWSSLEQASPPMSKLFILDVESAIASSSFPWTIEALVASAPLLRNQHDSVLLLVNGTCVDAPVVYTGGPLGQGVGVCFGASRSRDLPPVARDTVELISSQPGGTRCPKAFLSDAEALGPRMALPLLPQASVQAYMDLQAEMRELRDILKPPRRRSSAAPHRSKGMSRKKRTKIRQRASKLEAEQEQRASNRRRGYNMTNDAAIFQKRLNDCGECLATLSNGLENLQELLQCECVHVADVPAPIRGVDLSKQVLQVTRTSDIPTTLRIVVLSDTHGYEDQFLKHVPTKGTVGSFLTLPDADVLIHCGDFYGTSHSRLDAFLSAQAHIPQKFVIRGNHDPLKFKFSSAEYITTRELITLEDGTVLDARPFVRSRAATAMTKSCDIFASHEPPFGICDRTYRNERVGSLTLRHAVEAAAATDDHAPPGLWLCGHIHEGRGAVWHNFASSSSPATVTAVVNAANANAGKARRLESGPVVIDLVPKKE